MKHALLTLSAIVLCPPLLPAQGAPPGAPFPAPRKSGEGKLEFTSSNVQLLGWTPIGDFADHNVSASDCWGYTSPSGREYAIIGLSDGTGFVEVTDPGQPVMVDFQRDPFGASSDRWRCVKVHGEYAYVGSEAGGGIQVFDMTDIDGGTPPNRVTLQTTVTTGGCTTATHTLAIDATSGFLYRCGGGGGGCTQGLVAYSLANPELPILAGSWMTRYVHEAQVETWDVAGPYLGRQIALCFTELTPSGSSPRFQILDVTDKAAITEISSTSYTGGQFSHQGWTSLDKQHLYLNDEQDDGTFGASRTRVFDISDLAAPSYLGFFTSGASSTDHNLYVQSDRIYESNWRSGLRVFDNSNPTAPVQIGFFDTWPEDDALDLSSLWTNYPFFASGTVIGSDTEKGLFVWRVGPRTLAFDFPGGIPEFLDPGGESVQFTVTENALGDLELGSVRLHVSTGGAFIAVDATPLGGDLYEAAVPSTPCGSELDFYVSARSTDGVTWTDPPAGPTQVHQAVAAFGGSVAFADDMELSGGYLVDLPADIPGGDTASSGNWVRVNPVGTAAQPEEDHSLFGTQCWVTGQGPVDGALGQADVDFGYTSLRTPAFDASVLLDPHVSYWRWFSNNRGPSPDEDELTVHISNDGGASWVLLETVGPTGPDAMGGWIQHSARIAEFVAPTNDMRLRFRTDDVTIFGAGSIVEAAIDDLRVYHHDCPLPDLTVASVFPPSGPFEGGNVVTITGTNFVAGLTTVSFGALAAGPADVLSPSTLQVRVPRALGAGSGKLRRNELRVDVIVQTPGSDSLPEAYTYVLPEKTR